MKEKPEEISFVLGEENYLLRLIPTEVKKRDNRRINFTMILNGVNRLIEKKGILEAKIFAGDNRNDWEKIGTFREQYTNDPVEDIGKNLLELNIKNNRKITFFEYFLDDGSYRASALVEQKNHWYEKWNKVFAEKIVLNKEE